MSGGREFRALTDQMLVLIDQLRAVEQDKQMAVLGSPAFVELAVEAESLSRLIFRWSGMQLQLAEATVDEVRRGELEPGALLEFEPRALDRILANWREAQLRLEIARPGSPGAATAAADIEQFREEFNAAENIRLARDGTDSEVA